MRDDTTFLSACEIAALVRAGRLSAAEIAEASFRRIERLNPRLHAVATATYDAAFAAAREVDAAVQRGEDPGPLCGVPIGLKDLTETAGIRTTYGSIAFADNIPDVDALLVSRLRAAGAVVVAKTNTPEFGTGVNTRNDLFGTTVSPWDSAKSSGGSSGGSAVAVATGMCALAEGSDHGGSIRVPAAMNGVVGLRVSPGRIPEWPSPWLFDSFNVHGPLARTVEDAALMLSVMSGPDERAPLSLPEPRSSFADAAEGAIAGWRAAWSRDLGGLFPVDVEIASITARAASNFSRLGVSVEDAHPDFQGVRAIIDGTRVLRTAAIFHTDRAAALRSENVLLREFYRRTESCSVADVGRSEWLRSRLWDRIVEFFRGFDLLLMPTTQFATFARELPHPVEIDGIHIADTIGAVMATYAISVTGLPAISVPCGTTSGGFPVGLQIVGRWRREDAVLRAAAAFERAFPWADRRPPLTQSSPLP